MTSWRRCQDDFDALANGIIQQINQVHVQGVGMDGAFSELSGWVMPSEDLSEAQATISDGTFYVRVIDAATGTVERHAIDVDVSSATPDTMTSIAAKIDAISGSECVHSGHATQHRLRSQLLV